LAGVTAVIGSAVKAAIEDQAAQASLARQIKASTKATDAQIKGVEDYISSLGQSVAIADDEARPALQALVVATKDVAKAQDLLNVAIDISAGTGKAKYEPEKSAIFWRIKKYRNR
jgi:TATA-box binding protein (TBP) (component of TFIID and TFIIIB)